MTDIPGERDVRRKLGDAAVSKLRTDGHVIDVYIDKDGPIPIHVWFAVCADCGQWWEWRFSLQDVPEESHREHTAFYLYEFLVNIHKTCSHIK